MTRHRYLKCPAAACLVATTLALSACAVGPDFKAPPAPDTAGFAPPGELPPETGLTPLPGGSAQRFVNDLDIQGQWWMLFQSPELDSLIQRGLANSPTLEAATAAL